jgi:hypothetical protein
MVNSDGQGTIATNSIVKNVIPVPVSFTPSSLPLPVHVTDASLNVSLGSSVINTNTVQVAGKTVISDGNGSQVFNIG